MAQKAVYAYKSGKTSFDVLLWDRMILLGNAALAQHSADVGFYDVNRTYEQLKEPLGKRYSRIKPDLIESSLWCCNMLHEQGKFWHPEGKTFPEFVYGIERLNKAVFDRIYNTIIRKGEEGHD